jgi:hypothetical protein
LSPDESALLISNPLPAPTEEEEVEVPLNGNEGAAGFKAPGRIAFAVEVLFIPSGRVREVSRPESVSSTIRDKIH